MVLGFAPRNENISTVSDDSGDKDNPRVTRDSHHHALCRRYNICRSCKSSGLAREQFKEGDEEADRGNDGKTTSNSGLVLNGIPYYGKPRTARSGGAGCKIYSGAPTVSQTTG